MKTKTLRESLTFSSYASSTSSVTSEASTASSTTTGKKRSRRVSFATVEIREYPMILDESRVRIPYLTTEWESFNTSTSMIPDYNDEIYQYEKEKSKPLPAKERVLILLRAGYTADELREHLTKQDVDEKKRKNLFSKIKIFKFVQQSKRVVNRAA